MDEVNGLAVLRDAVADFGSKQAVATAMGVSRTAISLLLVGKYKGDPKQMYARAVATFGRFVCPYLQEQMTKLECHAHCLAEPPTQNPAAMRHYRACQSCLRCPQVQP